MSEIPITPHGEPSTIQAGLTQQLNRSCESCRSLKVRCLPSPSTPNQCQRCAKGKKACIFVAPQRRRPRKRTDSRVAQLEKEMRMMRSLLKDRMREESDAESPEESDAEDSRENESREIDFKYGLSLMPGASNDSNNTAHIMDYTSEYSNTLHSGVHENGRLSVPPSFSAMSASFSPDADMRPLDDVVDRGVISLADAERLVSLYVHELASFFPLVILPPNTTAATLRHQKPVLFLSVIAAASISVNADLAAVFDREMVRLYAERFFVEGEKSLELVQALLIMIIFYFPPASPLKLQFYQYTHIASTMALEIGLATKRRVSKNKSVDRKSRYESHDELLAEQARAVLGCYHLGSTVTMKTRRPNLLQFNDWMAECVKHLKYSPIQTDQHLAMWFQVQRITDQALSSFGLDDTSASSPLTESRVQAVLRWFDKQIETWKKNIPPDMLIGKPLHRTGFSNATANIFPVPMTLEYRSAVLAMYELGVGEGYREPDAIKRRYFTLPTLDGDEAVQSGSPSLSAIRIDLTVKWMHAAQELLDAALACDIDTLRKLPNLMYTRVGMAVTSLLKIHFSVRTGALGEVVTAQTVNVSFYLDAMAGTLAEAGAGGKYKIPSRWYHVIAVKGRDWYSRLETKHAGSSTKSDASNGLVSATTEPLTASVPLPHVHDLTHPAVDTMSPSTMDTFTVPPGISHIPSGISHMSDGYVEMNGAGMWSVNSGHNQQQHEQQQSNAPFFQPISHGYTQSHQPSTASLQPRITFDAQRLPPQGGGVMPGTGMELDGWLPDGSIFGMPPLPEF